ncbi:MAG: elongation factor 4, partial [bacterium]
DARVGDTITFADNPVSVPLVGYREAKPMVYSGLYPASGDGVEELREALEKLKLNDAAISFEPESSIALGPGFRCGFLGLLHMEIVQERLSREYKIDLVATIPNVAYRVKTKNGELLVIDNPAKLPNPAEIDTIEEPIVTSEVVTPTKYIGNIMKLITDRRGELNSTEFMESGRAIIRFTIPLAEIIFDFYDKLKSLSQGYASLDYELSGYNEADLVKLDVLVNGEPVDALSVVVHRSKAYNVGIALCTKLKELIPRQLFEVVIQAAIGSRIIARTRIPPIKKNVTAKCYGGDITRKRKLLERQKEGKKRMKQVGNVEIPQEAFFALFKIER